MILDKIESASREELNALQFERLKKTVARVYDNVEIYRKRMNGLGIAPDDLRSLEDLRRLPFTYKQDLRDAYPYGMFACPMSEVARLHASSRCAGPMSVGAGPMHAPGSTFGAKGPQASILISRQIASPV